jgi:hypothetical protein
MVYAWPESLKPNRVHMVAAAYVEPVFTQRWSMFAPCPTINSHVKINFIFKDGDSTGWVDPLSHAKRIHNYLPALHYGELVLSASNLDYWLGLDVNRMGLEISDPFPSGKIDEFHKGYSYYKIRNFILGWGHYLYREPLTAAEIKFIREDVVTGERGEFVLPKYDFSDVR